MGVRVTASLDGNSSGDVSQSICVSSYQGAQTYDQPVTRSDDITVIDISVSYLSTCRKTVFTPLSGLPERRQLLPVCSSPGGVAVGDRWRR